MTTDTITPQNQPPEPGVYYGIPFARYRDAKGLNASLLCEGRKSMKHVRYFIDHPSPDTPAKWWGRVLHHAVFEYQTFLDSYVVWSGAKRGKEWEACKAEHGPANIITEDQQLRALEAGGAITSHPLVQEIIDEGKPEVSMWWDDHALRCKGRIDWLRMRGETPVEIVDLKTTTALDEFAFGRAFERYGYHIKLGYYRRGIRNHYGVNLPVRLIVAESDPPFDAARMTVDENILDYGEQLAVGLLQSVKHCKKSGRWPGRAEQEEMSLAFPDWAMPEEEVVFDG